MNDYASQEECQYQSLQAALDLVQQGSYMAKIDLKSAYRSVRIHPSNYPATGVQWTFEGDTEPTYLVDTRLPFGSRKAPAIFNRLTQAVRRMMARRAFPLCLILTISLSLAPPKQNAKKRLLLSSTCSGN